MKEYLEDDLALFVPSLDPSFKDNHYMMTFTHGCWISYAEIKISVSYTWNHCTPKKVIQSLPKQEAKKGKENENYKKKAKKMSVMISATMQGRDVSITPA